MQSRWFRAQRAFALTAMLTLAGSSTFAQQPNNGTGTISGAVLDVTGKAIPGTTVSVKNESAGGTRSVVADAEGKFSAGGLAPGSYTVEGAAPSFASSRRVGVRVAANATETANISLNVGELAQSITVEGAISVAAETSPSQNTLETYSARSEVSPEFIQNFASPVADYTELLQYTPGTFSVNPNGVGLGDSKTFFRGFKDGQYTMQADGIPFNDSNSPTHHSWAFFPSQFIAGIDFDRSPGTASSIGPTNYGGTINLLSRSVAYSPDIRATAMYGSFNTRMFALDADTGQFGGKDKKSSITINLHQMLSDGYQSYNYQKRVAGFIKYQYRLNSKTTITAFSGLVDLWTNTPNANNPTRAQVAQYGYDYLMSGDPSQANYYGYNFYHVQTDFEYIGLHSELGHGWTLDNKVYTYRYWNKQNYNGTTISKTSATDKLNGYRRVGDTLALSKEWARGILRTGLWYEWTYTDRYQIPSDPRTWVNAPLSNFHEHFITTSMMPYIEYEHRITQKLSWDAGVRLAAYRMDLKQFADGKTVGSLNGAPYVTHTADYHSWNPSTALRYRARSNWSLYGQFAIGSQIPPSNVFDTTGAQVAVLPKPTIVKTYQVGSVLKFNRVTLDVDGYYSHFQNPYASFFDAKTTESFFYQTGPSNTKGVEAESNIRIGGGFSLYLNATMGVAKFAQTGLWIQNTPKNTEALGLTYRYKGWDVGFIDKRVGPMWNDNGTKNEAIAIDPFNVANLFVNYTVRGDSWLRGTKFRFGVNNLQNNHNIVGVSAASTASNAPAAGDLLTIIPARSFSVSMTFGYAPAR